METILRAFRSFTRILKSLLGYLNMFSSGDVSPVELERTKNFKMLSDSVYELLPEQKPDAVVVLFHGFTFDEDAKDNAFWRTWKRGNSEECWPVTLLPEYLNTNGRGEEEKVPCKIRVLAMSYNGSPETINIGNRGTDDYLLTEKFIQDLILNEHVAVGQEDENIPIFLVGHDLGGILIKHFVLAVDKVAWMEGSIEKKVKLYKFLDKLSSVFFYATPHSGSRAIEITKRAEKIDENTQHLGLKLMKVLGKEMARVNQEFSAYRKPEAHKLYSKCWTYAFYATHETNSKQFGSKSVMVVKEGSARNDVDGFHSIDADHFGVCQAYGLHSNNMTILGQRIRTESVAFKNRKPNADLVEMQKQLEISKKARTQDNPSEGNTKLSDSRDAATKRRVLSGTGSHTHTLQKHENSSEGNEGIFIQETASSKREKATT